jgi:hypothetical protein
MGVDCGLEDVFSDDLRRARNVVYAQIADVLRSTEDASRLAIVLSLEAAGAEFFQAIISFLERIGRSGNLLYFARSHQQVEQNHEIFEHDKSDFLRSLVLSPQAFEEANLVVERTFQTMTDLFDDVLEHIANDAEPKPARLVS